MTLPLKNMDDQLTHPLTPHPPCNKQSNQQQKQKTKTNHKKKAKNKQQEHTTTTTTTNKQQQQNNKSSPRSTYSTVLCFVFYVDCSPLFILWFSFCSRLFILLLWMRQTKLGLNGEKTSDARRNKTKTNLRLTIAQTHSLTVNSLQLDDSTVPLSDRQLPSA